MTDSTTTPPALVHPVYELLVAGHLDEHWSAVLDDLRLTRRADGTTILTGPVVDQAQLHGLLARVRDLGVTLLSLRTLAPPAANGDGGDGAGAAAPPTLGRTLRTARLTLRAAAPGDADSTWDYRRLESVGEWLTEVPADLDSYRTTFGEPGRLAATVIVERSGLVIGDFMLRVEDAWAQREVAHRARGAQAELGWVLHPAHTGHGYATEAVRALLDHCFTDLRVHRVVASCFLENDASWRLMERLGMRREGHAVGESLHRSGRWLDTVTYAVLASEWSSDPSHPRR